ncbi:hypothetical protein P7J12_11790, partial [Streptococcus suis]|uniref:hypothetical protein n=1 Tax=Streptococcus suis TaxID=1307 RepID=UPI0038BB0E05
NLPINHCAEMLTRTLRSEVGLFAQPLYKWVTPRFKLEMRNAGRRFSLYQGPGDLFRLEMRTAGRQFFYIRIGCFNREIGKPAICITWSSNFDGFLFISYLLISG